jgi:DNA-binding transcriptional regulator YiaG
MSLFRRPTARTAAPPKPALTRGEHLRILRNEYGLTQRQIGDMLFSKHRTVQDWESGYRNMPDAKWEYLQVLLSKTAKPANV